jgi:hypothetical protein
VPDHRAHALQPSFSYKACARYYQVKR